jgi:hypothetical protein
MRILNGAVAVLATSVIGMSIAAGCGGDSGGGGDVSTGLPPTRLLSDVTEEDAEQACERLQAGFEQRFNRDTVVQATCTLGAASFASTPTSCNDFRDSCIEEANSQGSETMMGIEFTEVDFDCGSGGMADLADCGDATVAELETCFNDTLDQLTALLNRFTCADAASVDEDDLNDFGSMVAEPAQSCTVLECGAGQPFGG